MNSECLLRMRGIAAFAILAVLLSPLSCPDAFAQVNVLTNKMDNSRSGLNPSETLLTPSNVSSSQFGKLYAVNVDGYVSAQPLYMSNLFINGGTHNVVFVATQHDSVYAFDADTGAQFWQRSFINPLAGIIPVPIAAQGCSGVTKFNEVGIVGTPVIDPVSGTLYVSAKTEVNGTTYIHTLYALDVTTGRDKIASIPIAGSSGSLTFDTKQHIQRPGLLLSNGIIYVAFGSNGCDLNARGWVFAYNASDLTLLPAVMTTQPDNSYGSSVWQGGVGPAADSVGNVYLSTANGLFQFSSFPDLGDSVLKLSLVGGQFTVADSFTPFDQATMAANDLDLGSGGDILLPDQTGNTPHLMVTSGKNGGIYLLNRDFLGGYNPTDNSQIPQYISNALLGEFFGSPLYWNQTVYFLAHQDFLRAYSLGVDINGKSMLSTAPVDQTAGKLTTVGLPVISANGTTNGIVWLVRSVSGVPLLSAYNASRLFLLYDSGMVTGGRDSLGTVTHFATPIVANGKVFAGTQTQLVAYGLFPAITVTAGNNQTGPAGSTLPVPLTITAINPYTGSPISGVTVTFNAGGKGTLGSPSAITDSNGVASTTYTLPNTPQGVTITATSPGYATATFTETGVVGAVATLTVVSGGKQVGVVGTTLPNPIVVKAKDAVGNVVPGASISFTDNATPHGSFNPPTPITDSKGQASTVYTLPTVAKSILVTASCGSVSVNISEQSVPASPAIMSIFQGNNQTAHPNNKLAKALIVLVTDQYGNGISGLTVNFTDNGANGIFSNAAPVTTTAGKATTTYTTGPLTGTVTITATYSTLTVNFTETVQ